MAEYSEVGKCYLVVKLVDRKPYVVLQRYGGSDIQFEVVQYADGCIKEALAVVTSHWPEIPEAEFIQAEEVFRATGKHPTKLPEETT